MAPPSFGTPAYARFLARLEAVRKLGVMPGNDRLLQALAKLGNPHLAVRAVHIAGTNGKGSTAAMVERVLRAAGRKTGLFTSPHLCRFTERIRIAGDEIDPDLIASIGEEVFAAGVPLTYFEVAAAIGFVAMARAGCDEVVLEVGLGGRLDSTNVCLPVATAVTSIALDHTDLLGPTVQEIAREKAGIAKRDVTLFRPPLAEPAATVVDDVAIGLGARIVIVTPASVFGPAPPPLPLRGQHQLGNAALAVALARQAGRQGGFVVTDEMISEGLAHVRWPGRLEEVQPGIWLDAAHNEEGARALRACLPPRPRTLVTSIVRGKAAAEMLAILVPAFDRVVLTSSQSARALPAEDLAALIPAGAGVPMDVVPRAQEALALACRLMGRGAATNDASLEATGGTTAAGEGAVVVAGSIFLVGEVRALLLGEPLDPIATGDPLP